MGAVLSLESTPDDCAAWAAAAPVGDGILLPFGVIDAAVLSQDGCLDLLTGLERVRNWIDAQQARVLARLASDPEPFRLVRGETQTPAQHAAAQRAVGKDYVREEIALALRWSVAVVAQRRQIAQDLVNRLPDTLGQMEAGHVSYLHAKALTEAVADLDDPTATQVQESVLPRAVDQTPAEFRRSVRRAVAKVDTRNQAEKHGSAALDRRVCYQPDQDAMAWLSAYLPAPDAQIVMTAAQAVADAHPDDGRTADQQRADALVAICGHVLSGKAITGLPRWQGHRPSVQVTVALSTLLGVDEQPGDLDGYGPIPADVARRIAADPSGTWHRLVTDPIGRLIDYGRTRYRPPQDLTDFVMARDQTCTRPGCHRRAWRCELDHLHDWANGGHTNAANLAPACGRDHDLKDIGWTVHRLPDGTTRWTSPSGRTYDKPPSTYPIDTTRPKIASDDPPPF